jgi:rhamnose transport system permease protein
MMYRFDATWWGFDVPWWTGIPVSIAVGAALGFGNGLLIQLFRLPAIIVTLGTLSLYRGLTFILSDAKQIDRQWIPTEIKGLSQTSILAIPKDFPIAGGYNIPWIVIIALGVAVLTYLFLDHTRIGRQVYAMGSNPTAAPLRGINVTQVTLLVFTLAGALSGLAGIMYASRWGFVNPSNTGFGFEFEVIAAVVIGGVSIKGGVGTVLGTVLGVLLLGCVSAALPLLRIPGSTQDAIYGAVILIALLIDRTVRQQGITSLKRIRA